MSVPRALSLFVLLGSTIACGGPSTPNAPHAADRGEARKAAAPGAAGLPAASASASATASPAPPVAPPLFQRLPAPTAAQLAGRCTAAPPIPIGTSSVTDASGPHVAVAASVAGVVAAWSSSDGEVTTRPLDSAGGARGGGRLLRSGSGGLFPRLWELGDGMFVLGFEPERGSVPDPRAPRRALLRVDATGEHAGEPVTFALDDVRDVTPFQNELLFLTTYSDRRELLRVTASKEGLAVRQVALPGAPSVKGRPVALRQRLLVTSKGAVRVLSDFGDGVMVLEREDGGRAELTLASEFRHAKAVLDADDEVLWPRCQKTPTVRAIKAGSGGAVEVEVDRSICREAPRWRVAADWNTYNNKNRGIVFTPSPLDPGVRLSAEERAHWFVDSTWTGTHVLAIYAQGKRGAWTVVVQPIACEGSPSGE